MDFSLYFLLVSFFFLILVLLKMDFNKYIYTKALILKVSEVEFEEAQRFYWLKHFYPEIEYEYELNGVKYKGGCGRKDKPKYRRSELLPNGDKRSEDDFFLEKS